VSSFFADFSSHKVNATEGYPGLLWKGFYLKRKFEIVRLPSLIKLQGATASTPTVQPVAEPPIQERSQYAYTQKGATASAPTSDA
jgi:hypothetical protein